MLGPQEIPFPQIPILLYMVEWDDVMSKLSLNELENGKYLTSKIRIDYEQQD